MVSLPDANILIYAYDEAAERHADAKAWFLHAMNNDQVLLTWQTIMAFIRITTAERGDAPFTIKEAIDIVNSWVERKNVQIISMDKRNWPLVADTIISGQAKGNLSMDAHLSALAMSCGATLISHDRDFRRFDGLKLDDPFQ